jgi:hypothetical protein
MMNKTAQEAPVTIPLYILLLLAISLCIWSFWLGTVLVRLWFYKGGLGPVPQKFIIIPHHRKRRELENLQPLPATSNRHTVFPTVAHLAQTPTNPFSDDFAVPEATKEWTAIPKITIEDSDDEYEHEFAKEYEDPARVRMFLAEERRISRLPAFEQDDCGNGSEFPDVPYATAPIERVPRQGRDTGLTYRQLGLQKTNSMGKWLVIDNSYIELHEVRTALLERRQADCVQVRRDGESACEELMDVVVQHLCKTFPEHFTTKMKHKRKHVRNELASKEYTLVRPFDCHPLGLCARLAAEDFCLWVKDEFTLGWYL